MSTRQEEAAAGAHGELRAPDRLYAGYVFDLDGTIYLGSALLPGAERLVGALRAMDRKVVFVSNNPTRDPDARPDYVLDRVDRLIPPQLWDELHWTE